MMNRTLEKNAMIGGLLIAGLAFGVQASAQSQERAQSQMLDMLRHAISIDTSAGQGSVPNLDHYLANKLKSAGFDTSDIEIVPYKDTATMVVRYPGKSSQKPVLFDMHLDVVPADPEAWNSNPFKLTKRDGYYVGRGIADMKTNAIAAVQAFMRLKREGFKPDRDMILILVGDEETSGSSLTEIVKRYKNADFVINGDSVGNEAILNSRGNPTLFKVQASEKTYADFTIEAKSEGGHSSEPTHNTAIYALANALLKIQNYQFPTRYNDITLSYLKTQGKLGTGATGKAMRKFAEDPNNTEAIATISADPASTGQIHTTCVATKVQGGHAENALPQKVTANINCRIFPGISVKTVQKQLAEAIDNDGIEIESPATSQASAASPVRPDIMKTIANVVHKRYPDVEIVPTMTSYATDNAQYRRLGIDSYDISPIFAKENNTYAHGKNERILTSEIPWVINFWHEIIPKLVNNTK